MKQVTAYKGYCVFASYDDLAPDTRPWIFCATEEVAQEVVGRLDKDVAMGRRVAYTEGFEYAKQWRISEALLENPNQFSTDADAALAIFGE